MGINVSKMMMGGSITTGMRPSMPIMGLRFKHEFAPRFKRIKKGMKGRVSVRTGGSLKGTKLEFGNYGIRLKSNGIRMTATQLKEAKAVVERGIRGTGASVVTRFVCNIAVCVKGNQTRMGKGKGAFSHWATRVRTGKVLFEIKGNVHEKIAKESLRKAIAKLPGVCEIMTKQSLLRVTPTTLIPEPPKKDFNEELKLNPSSKWSNVLTSKQDMYRLYRGR
ncbi:54S ribosomal protein L16, mitochondrial [[Candida] jaroonii]|uniref:54S ribosomal protein L16, mitochondrial n=1 Tax=[Candida] jaroonii TaxID=467808 RepID=A0ACA9Y7M6_9ASCO|nr:54S ribosomal protein L16, mitochondrial [[Candida] jaroonii]